MLFMLHGMQCCVSARGQLCKSLLIQDVSDWRCSQQ